MVLFRLGLLHTIWLCAIRNRVMGNRKWSDAEIQRQKRMAVAVTVVAVILTAYAGYRLIT